MKIVGAEGLLGRLVLCAVATTALLGLALVVGAVLVVSRGVPAPMVPAPESLAGADPRLPAPASGLTGAMVERPLFWSGRRPVEIEVEEVVDEPRYRGPDAFDRAQLAGVFASGPQSGVILRLGGERHRVMVGDSVGDWQLASLTPDSATFVSQQGGTERREERILQLEHAFVAAPLQEPSGDAGTEADSQRNSDE